MSVQGEHVFTCVCATNLCGVGSDGVMGGGVGLWTGGVMVGMGIMVYGAKTG